ncbi:hypothetical protein [Nostoc sphaeroides]|uniref:Uncharacterized protein n=1 Tax=Nostoc sphaeroides CCNUC1 TaxID=2653204 RepID=A0A5P8WBN3_9NOSO|nr:hypothetical protein [Nostoc sphaeroides]QFS50203.1 hypothetical protein GXM_07697 [Nostoc sphaeroides CCNUC1]
MRLVNGTQQSVYVYACHDPIVADGLTKAIEEFFAHSNPTAALQKCRRFHYQENTGIGQKLKANAQERSIRLTIVAHYEVSCLL